MPATKDLKNKYLVFQATKLIVKIPYINYSKEFKYRDHGGLNETIKIAIKERDEAFLAATGMAISEKTRHFKSRTGDPDLEPGLSFGYVNGKKRYVVVSYSKETMGNPSKIRFSIKKLGYEEALRLAREELNKKKAKTDC